MYETAGRKVLLIGWDAADWKVIQPLMDEGRMPNVRRIVENGCMARLATLHPPLSPMLWTSIATGKRPFKHGIHGFSEPTPDGRSIQPVSNLSRTCKYSSRLSLDKFRDLGTSTVTDVRHRLLLQWLASRDRFRTAENKTFAAHRDDRGTDRSPRDHPVPLRRVDGAVCRRPLGVWAGGALHRPRPGLQ